MSLVQVLLLDEWLGHPKNSVRNIPEWKFKELESRGVAKLFSDETLKESLKESKEDSKEDKKKEESKEPAKKRVGRPPKDKMMKSSEIQNK